MQKKYLFFFIFISVVAHSQQKTSSFVFLLGKDTIGYEQYTRTAEKITGNILTLSPKTTLAHFTVDLNSASAITHFDYVSSYPGSGTKLIEREMTFINDTTVRQALSLSGKPDSFFTRSFTIRSGSVPHIDFDISMYEQMIHEAALSGKDSFPVDRLTNAPIRSFIKKMEGNNYQSRIFGSPVLLKVDEGMQIVRYDATGSTIKVNPKNKVMLIFATGCLN